MIGNVVRRSTGRDDNRWMPFDREILRQVKWWRISLGAVHEGGTKIQDPGRKFLYPVDPVLVFSDTTWVEEASSTFKGMGVWEERSGIWLLRKWPGLVVVQFGKQLSFLEGVAGLVGLLMLVEEVVDRGSMVLLIDNIEVVWAAINQ